MTIRVLNATFESSSVGEFETVDAAYKAAMLSGLDIAASEIRDGVSTAIVEVSVDLVGARGVVRGAVSISTARFSNSGAA